MTENKKQGGVEKKERKREKAGGRGKTPRAKTSDSQVKRKLKQAQEEIEILKDRLLRSAAEVENVRKRTEREILHVVQNANSELIRTILPVIDDFERSLKIPEGKQGEKEFRRGVALIHQKLMDVLHGYGLERMESVDKPFDVELHDALLQVKREGTPPGVVVEEHEKGYFLNGKVLRHAKVVVSQ